jgi:hypothetical protein
MTKEEALDELGIDKSDILEMDEDERKNLKEQVRETIEEDSKPCPFVFQERLISRNVRNLFIAPFNHSCWSSPYCLKYSVLWKIWKRS